MPRACARTRQRDVRETAAHGAGQSRTHRSARGFPPPTNLLRDWGRAAALKRRSQLTVELASNQQLDQVAALESRDTLRRLEEAIGKLKPKTREIFLAHRIHGFTYAEIADQTGLSIKGVEKQMSKAIAKIDRLLDRG